jgi:hypothetical protein
MIFCVGITGPIAAVNRFGSCVGLTSSFADISVRCFAVNTFGPGNTSSIQNNEPKKGNCVLFKRLENRSAVQRESRTV